MKKITLMIFAVFTLFPSGAFSAQTIRLAVLPMVSEAEVFQQFSPFNHYISDITRQPVELVYWQNYKKLLDELINDHIDLAFLGPLPYVILTNQDNSFIPIARFVDANGNANYTCSLIAFDCDVAALNVKQARIALTQPYSTCGYLYTKQLLKKYPLNLEELSYYYAGQHSTCALDVIRGTAQIAGVKTSIARQYSNLGLRIIAESEPIPGFLLVANSRTLEAGTIDKIRSALLQLDPRHNQTDAKTTATWGKMIRYGAIPVIAEGYQQIRQLFEQTQIPGVDN
ncbi:MAG: PhnD/SsuA/transferrin family substrate-binding protein [Thermodesulfobacteriota bacterium]|nr:PhnD/SsuA/transferrin family substrate-binding protein [Thermodesulfobacteriota bacterium]